MPKPRHGRSVTRIGAAVAVAGVMALALSGCVGAPAPTPTPTVSPSAEPIFASDEEALAAAEAAYAAYLRKADEIGSRGGTNPDDIRDVVAPAYASELIASFDRLGERGLHTVGATSFDGARLADYSLDSPSAEVTIYVCLDVSGVRVVGGDGADVTPIDRILRAPLQAHFVSSSDSPMTLLPSGSEAWTGDDFC
jgi:hypothetical protein